MTTLASGSKTFFSLFFLIVLSADTLADFTVPDTLDADFSLLENRPVRLACNVFPPQKISLPSETTFPGYDIEIIQEAFLSQGLATEFSFFPWKRAYLLVESGEFDALCSCSWRPERDKAFWYSEEMGNVSKGIFSIESQAFNALSDLRDHKVGVVSGYNLEEELKVAGISDIQSVVSDTLLLNLLLYKRVEAIYSYENTVNSLLKVMSPRPRIMFRQIENAPYYLCISRAHKGGEALVGKFNSGLQKLRSEGRYQSIIQRYLGD